MQVKGSTLVVLVYVVAVASVALIPYPEDPPDPTISRFQTSISVWKDGTDTILDIRIRCPDARPLCQITADVVELEIDGVSQYIRLVWWEVDETQGKWLIIVNVTAPYSVECPLNYEEFDEMGGTQAPEGSMTLSYNMGEVTGAPLVRARAHMFYPAIRFSTILGQQTFWESCCPVGLYWGPWSPMIEAVPPQPLPLIEIATVIGIGGIVIAILNNYLQGRREQKATEITRTAAEDERFMELYDASREPAFQENMAEVLYQYKWTDYEDFQAKYGPKTNVRAWAQIQSLAQYFEGIGVLVEEGSIDIGRVYRLLSTQVIRCWEKLGPIILEQRQRELDLSIYNSFERLYYAIKKYQQDGPPPKDEYARPFKDYTPQKE